MLEVKQFWLRLEIGQIDISRKAKPKLDLPHTALIFGMQLTFTQEVASVLFKAI